VVKKVKVPDFHLSGPGLTPPLRVTYPKKSNHLVWLIRPQVAIYTLKNANKINTFDSSQEGNLLRRRNIAGSDS